MPTLLEFLDVYRDTKTFINIELKGPKSESRKHLYDYKAAAELVYKTVL
jgi:hypothetical protein